MTTQAQTNGDQLNAKHLRYLDRRGLSPETVLGFGLASSPDGNGICFPYNEFEQPLNVKVWQPPKTHDDSPTWRFVESGKDLTFFNFDILQDPAVLRDNAPMPVVITEGEWDCLSVAQSGYPFVCSMPNGAPPPSTNDGPDDESQESPGHSSGNASGSRYAMIHRHFPLLKRVKRWVIATDNDPPGMQLAQDLVRRLGPGRCSFVTYPEDCKDFNDVLVKHGPEAVAEIVAKAKPYPVKGLFTLDDLPAELPRHCVSTGWPNLDVDWKPYPGQFTVLTGIPGVGKTTLLMALVGQLAELHGWSVCLGALENSPEDYIDALMRFRLRGKITKPGWESDEPDVVRARNWIKRQFVFIAQDVRREEDELTLDEFLDAAESAVIQHDVRLVMLDPVNQLESSKASFETDTDYADRCIRAMMRFARRMKVAFICVVHPTKSVGDLKDPASLSLYHCSGSAHWANKPHAGLVLWREIDSSVVNVRVAKNRYVDSGKQWTVAELQYEPHSGRYSDATVPGN